MRVGRITRKMSICAAALSIVVIFLLYDKNLPPNPTWNKAKNETSKACKYHNTSVVPMSENNQRNKTKETKSHKNASVVPMSENNQRNKTKETKSHKNASVVPIPENRQTKKTNEVYKNHDTRVVPISAYFDSRPQQSHTNATVILLSVERRLKNSIVGCEVDDVTNLNPLVEEIYSMRWIHQSFKISHTDCIMYCWDMKVSEDSVVKVIWKLNNETIKELVRTPNVVFSYRTEKNEVMVCTTGFGGTISYLDQWLTYQQTIGVKLIHLNVEESFIPHINSSTIVSNLTDKGIVNIVRWKEYLNSSQVYYFSQALKYMDCIFRYLNTYRYMMIIDFDEYFMPAGVAKDIKAYVTAMFKNKTIGSIHLPTIVYACRRNQPDIYNSERSGNITANYDTKQYIFTPKLGKSIHKVKAIKTVNPHFADGFFPGFRTLHVCKAQAECRAKAYVAHFSHYQKCRKHCNTKT